MCCAFITPVLAWTCQVVKFAPLNDFSAFIQKLLHIILVYVMTCMFIL